MPMNFKEIIPDFDADYLRQCRNYQCKRRGTPVYTDAKRCPDCGSRLKSYRYTLNSADIPPIIEMSRAATDGGTTTAMTTTNKPPQSTIIEVKVPRGLGFEMKVIDLTLIHYCQWDGNKSSWDCVFCDFETTSSTTPAYEQKQAHDTIDIPTYNAIIEHFESLKREARTHVRSFNHISSQRPSSRGDSVVVKNDTWGCNDAELDGCPIFKAATGDTKPRIYVPHDMWERWFWLTQKIDTEWIAYLIGAPITDPQEAPPGSYKVTSMYFPKQIVASAHVEVEGDDQIQQGVIGDVHSHVGMGVFFSAEDKKHMNHDIHIIVNRKREWVTAVRAKLECGRYTRTEATVYLEGLDPNHTKALEDFRAVANERKYSSASSASSSSPTTRYHNHEGSTTWNADSTTHGSRPRSGPYSGPQEPTPNHSHSHHSQVQHFHDASDDGEGNFYRGKN